MEARRHEQSMNWYSEEDKLLRRYLLDDVTAEERRLVEEKLLSEENNPEAGDDDLDFVDRLLLAEDELIDDYAQEVLSDHERRVFESSFATGPERKEKLSLTTDFMVLAGADAELVRLAATFESKRTWWHTLLFPEWKMIAYASLAIILGFVVWRVYRSESDLTVAKAEIRRIYGAERPLEVRISDYGYARFSKTLGSESKEKDYVALDRVERILLDEIVEHPTVETQHELGRLYLARHKFDKAKSILEQALQTMPNDARLHSDLGAVFFELWDRQRSSGQTAESDLLKQQSIEHLMKALALDNSLREARFNLALLYQAANQPNLARAEWEKYIALEPDLRGKEEAQRNLKMLK